MELFKRKAFISTIFCFVFMSLGFIFTKLALPFAPFLYLLAIGIGGFKQTKEGLTELFFDHTLNVDLLMALAAIGACLIGNYFEGAMLTFIFCLSGALEEYTTNKSQKEITALMNLQPQRALKLFESGETKEVDVTELTINDKVFVPKGAAIPIDGQLTSPVATIDEAAISGESVPVEKQQKDPVFAGTLNQGNPFTMTVTKLSSDTVFAKIIQLVEEAQNTPTKTASFIERIENTYVKLVLLSVPLMILLPPFLAGWTWEESFYRGMVLLVVASPCALVASATPATLAALSNAAKNGILIKGGIHLEQLAELKAVAFDKTGTLTRGKPIVTDSFFLTDDPVSKNVLVAMESQTTHPLAEAITTHFGSQSTKELQQLTVEEITGFGLTTNYQGSQWHVGKHAYSLAEIKKDEKLASLVEELENQGKTVIFFSKENELLAIFGLLDVPKTNAAAAIHYFNESAIHTSMITGDNLGTAKAIATQVGLSAFHAGCTPEEKTALIKQEQIKYQTNAMVGDGVNDAPALATATLGIAMGKGTDIAIDVADLVLMNSDLDKLVYSHRLSLKLKRIIKQNIVFSVGVIVLLILSNFLQFLNLPFGVIGHEGSTILVILNGLRMLQPLAPLKNDDSKRCTPCPLYQAAITH